MGPVQFGLAKSVEPISPMNITTTCVAVITEKDAANPKKENGIGHKYVVPYGLYICEGHVSANLANKGTGFSEGDLRLLWDAILNMFENDRAAGRSMMSVKKLIIFKHSSIYGDTRADKLFDSVRIERADKEAKLPARSYSDYKVCIDYDKVPDSVEVIVMD